MRDLITVDDYRKEADRLSDALDVIVKFEEGDSLYLKRAIRAERDRIDEIIEKMEVRA